MRGKIAWWKDDSGGRQMRIRVNHETKNNSNIPHYWQ